MLVLGRPGYGPAVDGDFWSDTWQWWLDHGLDGIGGALVAVAGVALTLGYDRRKRREDQRRHDQADVRAALAPIVVAVVDASEALRTREEVVNTDVHTPIRALEREMRLAQPTVTRSAPDLASDLRMCCACLSLVISGMQQVKLEKAHRLMSSIQRRCEAWLEAPDRYNKRTLDRGEELVWGSTITDALLGLTGPPPTTARSEDPEGPRR